METHSAVLCAVVSFALVILLMIIGLSLAFDLSFLPLIGEITAWVRDLAIATFWICLAALKWLSYLYPLSALLLGYSIEAVSDPYSRTDQDSISIWGRVTFLSAVINALVRVMPIMPERGGMFDWTVPWILFGTGALTMMSMIAGMVLHKGISCARDAGWLR